jgi:hypothetical protein
MRSRSNAAYCVLLLAFEGANEVALRVDELFRHKHGGGRAPCRWYADAPRLLPKGALDMLVATAQRADDDLRREFKLHLGLLMVDTLSASAGYPQAGGENDTATNQALMNVLRALAQMMNWFVLAIDHYGKNIEAGTRGASSKEASADLVLACLGTKSLSGPSTTPGWLRAKIAAGSKVSSTPSA